MKYVVLVASVAMQLCLGSVYAWSTLATPLESKHSLSSSETNLIFGCLIGVFTVTMVLAGKLIDRFGPRLIASVGGLLFGSGLLIASYSGGSFAVMLLGISLVTGAGVGAGYVCPLTTCMKWFPENRGLVTGISMAGFGGGAVLLASLAKGLLTGGMHVLTVFFWVGLAYGVVLLVAASVLHFPTASKTSRVARVPPVGVLGRDPFFWALVLGMFSGTFAGMLVIGNLEPIALAAGLPSVPATVAVSVFAVGNAAGRITWGWICDRFDERMIPVKLALLAVPLVFLALVESTVLFIVVSFAIGFGFGACFVVYAAQVASRYGLSRVGGIYPIVFLSYGVAGIAGPALGGWLKDLTASYTAAVGLSCGVVAVGIFGSALLLRKAKTSRLVSFSR